MRQVKPPFGSNYAMDALSFQDNDQQKYDIFDCGDRVLVSHKDRKDSIIAVPITDCIRLEYHKASDAPQFKAIEALREREAAEKKAAEDAAAGIVPEAPVKAGPGRPPKPQLVSTPQ